MTTTEFEHPHEYDPDSGCYLCRDKKPFEFPERLVEDCLAGRIVIFAGAGISSEGRHVMPHTLYDDVLQDVGASPADGVTFPLLMSRFEAKRDRSALLQKIKHRLDYIDSFVQLENIATRFHRELSSLFPITDIVTTNWDTYFERFCGATPIVAPEDYAFWTLPGRKVFKIHGSMNNVGSIIATEQDYETCYEDLRAGIIGASLKHMLATKTPVFVGYSFRDEDFNKIYAYLSEEMGRILPRSFIVTLDSAFDASAYPGATVIETDATYFLSVLKARLLETVHFIADERFEAIPIALATVAAVHERVVETFPANKFPDVIYTASYQDGLIDAFERILRRSGTGEYSHFCDVRDKVKTYIDARSANLKKRKYEDVAYITGYENGLIYLIADDEARKALPMYFTFGDEPPETLSELRGDLKNASSLHKTAHARALKIVGKHLSEDNLVYHHAPFFSFEG